MSVRFSKIGLFNTLWNNLDIHPQFILASEENDHSELVTQGQSRKKKEKQDVEKLSKLQREKVCNEWRNITSANSCFYSFVMGWSKSLVIMTDTSIFFRWMLSEINITSMWMDQTFLTPLDVSLIWTHSKFIFKHLNWFWMHFKRYRRFYWKFISME